MTKKTIEKIIEAICPSCIMEKPPYLEKTKLKYGGKQEIPDSDEVLYLYTCERCGSTASLESIKEVNP